MGENSKIQWTHHTHNPWVGCKRVSPGCERCYAEAYDKRVGGAVDPSTGAKALRWGPKAPRIRTSPANWRKPLRWDAEAKAAGERRRVFCASLADVFEDRHELGPWRLELLDLIRLTPALDWLLLTKRPHLVRPLLSAAIDESRVAPWDTAAVVDWVQGWLDGRPPPNVWLGTTVEDQRRAHERVPELLAVPAAVRFLSCEPLLEAVDLRRWLDQPWAVHGDDGRPRAAPNRTRPDWVIVGGESGPGARPFDVAWARSLVRQCRAAGVASFVKQLGSRPIETDSARFPPLGFRRLPLRDHAGGDMAEWPADLRVREFPGGPT